ncbi:hypothetical protein IP90_01680 [Luteimonas cucumeris]|uniref:Uncharacterized protein n=1 Tax=Luteimonas cucumeris TaxID=985012 RepID=A0A562L861_9GAMM|nr:hypothetical protein [Luteimonas cucumeris]TWI03862.1 hypothetical protein IP90_01680 [Luteimonas cucumeris]
MDEFGWLMLLAAPFVLCASLGLMCRKAWHAGLFAGVGSAGLYAAQLYSMQLDMVRRGPPAPGAMLADPLRVAMEAFMVTFPIGLCIGLAFHFIARSIWTKKA